MNRSDGDDVAPIRVADDDGAEILDQHDESTESTPTDAFGVSTYYQRGREQRHWVVDRADSDPIDYSLGVWEDGVVTAIRTVPYDGQRRYSTEDRRNRADKNSQFRLSVDEVLVEYIERGEPGVSVDELRRRVLAVLRRDDVAADPSGQVDPLADEDERRERELGDKEGERSERALGKFAADRHRETTCEHWTSGPLPPFGER